MHEMPEMQFSDARRNGQNAGRIQLPYSKCHSCGEEIVNMKQLHEVAQKYRTVSR